MPPASYQVLDSCSGWLSGAAGASGAATADSGHGARPRLLLRLGAVLHVAASCICQVQVASACGMQILGVHGLQLCAPAAGGACSSGVAAACSSSRGAPWRRAHDLRTIRGSRSRRHRRVDTAVRRGQRGCCGCRRWAAAGAQTHALGRIDALVALLICIRTSRHCCCAGCAGCASLRRREARPEPGRAQLASRQTACWLGREKVIDGQGSSAYARVVPHAVREQLLVHCCSRRPGGDGEPLQTAA